MITKSSGKKITSTCDDCKLLLREAQAYYTLAPKRRLCRLCMAKYLDIKEMP